jgi:hypothetical protein
MSTQQLPFRLLLFQVQVAIFQQVQSYFTESINMAKTSTRPMVRIHNSETNEVIDREMNDDEFAQYEADKAARIAADAAVAQKAADRAALLAQLGITEEQAKLLLG